MIGCSGRRVPPEDAELDLVGPGLEEVEGDLGPVHHRDLPLVDHQDVVPGPEAALPRGAGLHHAAKWGSEHGWIFFLFCRVEEGNKDFWEILRKNKRAKFSLETLV